MPEWGREPDLADLGGIAEIAAALGVGRSRVKRWIERRASTNAPEPVRQLAHGNLYRISEWRSWYALWRITREAPFEAHIGVPYS